MTRSSLLLLSFSALVFGQGTATIVGTVSDPFGHPFAIAPVQAKNVTTNTIQKTTANAKGEYSLSVEPGTYTVAVNLPAMRPFERAGVIAAAGKSIELKIMMQETTQLGTLGEDTAGALADAKLHAPPTGPTPRTVSGKPDLSGVWWRPIDVDPGKPVWLPNAQAVAKERLANNSVDSPQARCLPSPITRLGPLVQLVQSPQSLVMINDDESPGFRQYYLDGREHPKEPDPDLWYGHNTAHWEDDTLVVDRVSFNELVWLDQGAHPHSDKLHVIERYRRTDLGHLEQTVTVEDPGVLAQPWVIKRVADLAAKESIREFICAENNRDMPHMVGK